MNLERLVFLLHIVTEHAKKHHDGHFTIMKFTTGYKAFFGTPEREEIASVPGHDYNLEAALEALIRRRMSDGEY